jgi:MFS family permease
MNLLNLHSGLQTFADNLGGLFLTVLLYQRGFSLETIFFALSLSFFARPILRPFSLWLCERWSLKKVMVIGTLIASLLYPALGFSESLGFWFIGFLAIYTLTDVFYWLPYHTMFAILGDAQSRGRQTGLRDGLLKITETIAPICSGFIVAGFGYQSVFWISMTLSLFSVLPLVLLPSNILARQKSRKPIKEQTKMKGFWLYFSDGFATLSDIIWALLLFQIVLNPLSFGTLFGISVGLQWVLHLFSGKAFDEGKAARLLKIGAAFLVVSILGRALIASSIPEILLFDLFFAIGVSLFAPAFNAAFYKLSKKSHDSLEYQYYSEMGWDIGAAIACLMVSGLVLLGFGLRLPMIISTIGIIASLLIILEHFDLTKLKKQHPPQKTPLMPEKL